MNRHSITQTLGKPVDAAILVYYRIIFGAFMAWEMAIYLWQGRVSYLWSDPDFHFKYHGFEWVAALPGYGVHIVCGFMLAAAIGIAIGWRYRICSTLFAIGICYLFLIDQAKYMNHFYLMCLLAWVNVFLPANTFLALDSRRNHLIRKTTVPTWSLWILRFQMGVVYFYGGIAKLNADWLRGNPMRQWLQARADTPVVGRFLESEAAPWLFSYGGLLFDLLVVPALLWKRTRLAAFAVAALFHITNSQMFSIGIFPWLALGLTALFFDPSWPRQCASRMLRRLRVEEAQPPPSRPYTLNRWTLFALTLYASLQLLVPLRHHLYPGNVSWTEEGHRFAWHMMLRTKETTAAAFFVIDPDRGEQFLLDPGVYLSDRQYRKMLGQPDMLQQFAAYIAKKMNAEGYPNAQVKAVIYCSLNGRPPALLVDPNTDLGSVIRSIRHSRWILPLDQGALPTPAHPDISIDDDQ